MDFIGPLFINGLRIMHFKVMLERKGYGKQKGEREENLKPNKKKNRRKA